VNEAVSVALSFVAGVLLGALFFGGLWWTVRQGLSSQWPARWFLGSLLVRMTIALTGFYVVGRDHWERWLVCLVGFLLARLLVQLRSRTPQAAYAP